MVSKKNLSKLSEINHKKIDSNSWVGNINGNFWCDVGQSNPPNLHRFLLKIEWKNAP